MSNPPLVSVVIASHGRPKALMLCLQALLFQTYRPFEVIVVACEAGFEAVHQASFARQVKLWRQGDDGLSVARNLGVAQAAGDIIAFIDDDAVADPPWLARLVQALEVTRAAMAGGWVRASNGISFEWTGGALGADLNPDHGAPTLMGTNMAVRADILRALGGFDPVFSYYLDEADLAYRVAQAGHLTVPVPRAQVHHAGAPNVQRGAGRVPRGLARIGQSERLYLRRHATKEQTQAALPRLRAVQKARLLRMMVTGDLGPEDVRSLLRDYDKGVKLGEDDTLDSLPPVQSGPSDFRPYTQTPPQAPVYIGGRVWQRASKLRKAVELAEQGQPVSLFLFSPTALYHRRAFCPQGVWIQTGGLYGRTGRTHPLAQMNRFSSRLKKEITRVAESFSDVPKDFSAPAK